MRFIQTQNLLLLLLGVIITLVLIFMAFIIYRIYRYLKISKIEEKNFERTPMSMERSFRSGKKEMGNEIVKKGKGGVMSWSKKSKDKKKFQNSPNKQDVESKIIYIA